MFFKNKLILILLFLSLFLMPINNVSSINNSQNKPDQGITLNVMTRHASDIFKPYKDAFLTSDLATSAGVSNILFTLKEPADWVIEANTHFFDVAWGGGPTLFDALEEQNLLPEISDAGVLAEAAHINETISGVPLKRYNTTCNTDCSGNPTWIAAAISSFGFTVNHDVLEANGLAVPRRWADLANASYFSTTKPLVAIGNAPDTTSNTRIYEIILQALGWEEGWALISAIAGNSVIYHGSTEVLNAVTLGEVGIAITIDFYGYQSQNENPSTEYIIPQGQSIVNGDPISLLDGPSANREAANAFVQFVLSKEGQKIWLKDTINRLPVREDFVFTDPDGFDRSDLKTAYDIAKNNVGIDFNDSLALSYSKITLSYFQTAITDNQDELHAGWGKIVSAYNSGKITRDTISDWIYSFGYPIISESQAISYQSQSNNITLLNQWRSDMKAQYTSIGAEAAKTTPAAPKTSPVDYFYVPIEETSNSITSNTGSGSNTNPTSKSELVSPGFEIIYLLSVIPIAYFIRKRKIN
jgi:ABC-type Fe3+ transport system substrate-binding protein